MATILIHAGMPKTGSTSIQVWLRRNAQQLAESGMQLIADAGLRAGVPSGLRPFEASFDTAPNQFLLAYIQRARTSENEDGLRDLAIAHAGELSTLADRHGGIIMTNEGISGIIHQHGEPYLEALEGLTKSHQVRVVSYVRPQAQALESRWRQWGYHNTHSPSSWFADQMTQLHYLEQLDAAQLVAPSVDFDIRPFRRDLLLDGDVVTDFRSVLGVETNTTSEPLNENPGLSLDLSMLLFGAPRSLMQTFDDRGDGGRRQLTLASVTSEWDLKESADVRRVRQILQSAAHNEFASGNAELIRRLGWQTDSFTDPADEPGELAELDELIVADANDTSRAYLHQALLDLCRQAENANEP